MKKMIKRYKIKIYGVVQGVGFRPYIYNQAQKYNIKGSVSNQGSSVLMDIVGDKNSIKNFLLLIIKKPPQLAKIARVEVCVAEIKEYKSFLIKTSTDDENDIKFISPDMGICQDCLEDILNPESPRFNYPFTNCTNCGPRYSLIDKLPYDRENTEMAIFKMCPECQNEYYEPSNRRFHAQTNCCPKCGPKLSLFDSKKNEIMCEDAISQTIEYIKDGKIIAIKGIGGFHFACDAFNEHTVNILRKRKNRPQKPFAIMAKNIEEAKKLCYIDEIEEKIILSNKKAIVLLRKKESSLPDCIAPNMRKLGIMLPYTPLHCLLFKQGVNCLVMTSGNKSNSPIQYENQNAFMKLHEIADYFLIHNREIHIPVEDSVIKSLFNKEIISRRARSLSPLTIPMNTDISMLALGAEEKSTFSILQNKYLYLSEYLGDLKNYDSYKNYAKSINNMMKLLCFEPEIIVHDLHEGYQSTRYAELFEKRKIPVQHHHAHMASCMVEHNLYNSVIGVIFDGIGLGTDGNIWGGEFFIGSRQSVLRVGHLDYVTIQGGDKAVKEPWRIALSYLYSINYNFNDIIKNIDEKILSIVKTALMNKLNCYETSSMGRFFDCVASLLNICQNISYDAQASIELENILDSSVKEEYACVVREDNGQLIIEYKDILLCIINDIKSGIPPSIVSAKFHNTIVKATVELVVTLSKMYNLNDVVLSGGVFENCYLLQSIKNMLEQNNLNVFYNEQIPTNDSGISAGQLTVAEALISIDKATEGENLYVHCNTR